MKIKTLALALAVAAPVSAGVYLNGEAVDGVDIYIVTSENTAPTPTPTPEPTPEPTPPPSVIPAYCQGKDGLLPLTQPKIDLTSAAQPQVEVTSTGRTAGVLIGTSDQAALAYGFRPGSTGSTKFAAITTCPIWSNDYIVKSCVSSGSSTISVKANYNSNCTLEEGKTYFLIFGNNNCTQDTCRAARNVYK